MITKYLIVLFIAFPVFLSGGSLKAEEPDIKIGVIYGLTGSLVVGRCGATFNNY